MQVHRRQYLPMRASEDEVVEATTAATNRFGCSKPIELGGVNSSRAVLAEFVDNGLRSRSICDFAESTGRADGGCSLLEVTGQSLYR